jgi:drug/metabolite transporter (DMT)-like permease
MYFIPFIGALSFAIIALMEKLVLRTRKINVKIIHVYGFFSSIIVMLPIIYFFWEVNQEALEIKNLLIFLSIILISIVANLLAFYSLKREKLMNIEPARMLEPLFVILLVVFFSFFFSLYEKELHFIIPALIASLALIFSHFKKNHLHFNKYFLAAIGGSFLFATELVLSRFILEFYNPISFYFLRCTFIFLISFLIFRPTLKQTPWKIKKEIFLIGFFWVIYRLAVYYGYINVGVVTTTLILLLAPVLIYFFAWKFLKEKTTWKNIISAIIILGCVVYVVVN